MFIIESWKQLESLEGFDGLNALDVGSSRYKKYFKIIQELSGSRDTKKLREAEYLLQYYYWFKSVYGERFKRDNLPEEKIVHEDQIGISKETELCELIL